MNKDEIDAVLLAYARYHAKLKILLELRWHLEQMVPLLKPISLVAKDGSEWAIRYTSFQKENPKGYELHQKFIHLAESVYYKLHPSCKLFEDVIDEGALKNGVEFFKALAPFTLSILREQDPEKMQEELFAIMIAIDEAIS